MYSNKLMYIHLVNIVQISMPIENGKIQEREANKYE